jgi:DNA-binding response OmpR family regulator
VKPMLLLIQFGDQLTRYDTPDVQQHYQLRYANDGIAAMGVVERQRPALLVVRVRGTHADDVALCQRLAQFQIPILALLADAFEPDLPTRLAPFVADYLPYPVRSADLLERVAVALARQQVQPVTTFQQARCGDLLIDLAARQLQTTEGEIKLTPTEWDVLTPLVRAAGTLVPYDVLRRQI